MNKKKKNGFLKIAGIMAVVMMLTTCVVSGTMAKYVSTGNVTGVPSATPAKWSITVGGTDFVQTENVTLSDLNWTVNKLGGTESAGLEQNKIAPGTWGYAEIQIQNTGDVGATLALSGLTAPTESPDSQGLTFGFKYTEAAKTSYADINGGTNAVGGTITLDKGASIYLYVYYEWKYDNDGQPDYDANDTTLGKNAATITFGSSMTITATQVNPSAA